METKLSSVMLLLTETPVWERAHSKTHTIPQLRGGITKGCLWAPHKDFTLDTPVLKNKKLESYLIEF